MHAVILSFIVWKRPIKCQMFDVLGYPISAN